MKTINSFPAFRKLAVGAVLVVAAGTASGASVPLFPETIDASLLSSPACAPYGDFISCSAQYLNFLTTGSVDGSTSINFVLSSSQGILQDALVVFTGGQAAVSNTEFGTNIDNAYRGSAAGSITTYGTSINAGEANPPNGFIDPTTAVTGEVSGAIGGTGDSATAWDIGLSQLISALTIDGVRHDLLVMFDNNQTGTDVGQDILASALVCVRDSTGGLGDKCFELIDQNGNGGFPFNVPPDQFATTKEYGDALGDNAVLANGTVCVDPTTKLPTVFNVSNCPDDDVLINNNLGTNQTEFIVSIPELNAQLEAFLALGYDLLSVQFLFTNNNDGFEDIFLLAGAARTTQVPEPDTIALFGLGLLGVIGIGAARRRRKI